MSKSQGKGANNEWKYIAMSLIFLAILSLLFLFLSYLSTQKEHSNDIIMSDTAKNLSEQDKYIWKSPSLYTIVLYGGLNCTYCYKLHENFILNRESFSGKFNFIYRNYPPLSNDAVSLNSAVLSQCVYENATGIKIFDFIAHISSNTSIFQSAQYFENIQKEAYDFVQNTELFRLCLTNPLIKKNIQDIQKDPLAHFPTIEVFYDQKRIYQNEVNETGILDIMRYITKYPILENKIWDRYKFEDFCKDVSGFSGS